MNNNQELYETLRATHDLPDIEIPDSPALQNYISRALENLDWWFTKRPDYNGLEAIISSNIESIKKVCSLSPLPEGGIDDIGQLFSEASSRVGEFEEHGGPLAYNAEAVLVEQYGGCDMGSEYWLVFEVFVDAKSIGYYKVPGWYQSHYGCDLEYESAFKVKQIQKTISVWEEEG